MADDSILRVGAEFDVSKIVSGAAQASTAFEGMGAKIAQVSTTMGTANAAGIDNLARSLKSQNLSAADATSVLTNLGYSQKEATAAVTAAFEPTIALTGAIDAQTAATTRLSVAQTNTAGSLGNITTRMGEARVVMGGLEGSAGMMAGGLARIAGQSQLLAPLIEAAFPIFGAAAFVAIVGMVAEKIDEATDAIAGWDKAAQKAYQEAANANIALLRTNLNQQSEQQKQNEIGLEGVAKQHQATMDLTADMQRYNAAAIEATHAVTGIQAEIAKLKSERLEAAFDPTKFNFATLGKDIDDANKQLEAQIKLRDELTAKVTALKIETEAAQKTTAADQSKAVIESEVAKAAAIKTIQEAQLAFAESVTKREYQDHRITLEQEVEELRTEENNKAQIIRDSIAAQEKELRARHAATGEDIGPKLTALNAQREAEETAHQSRLTQIEADGARERFQLDQAAALHHIDIDRQIAAAYDEATTHKAETAYHAADTVAEIESTSAEYVRAHTAAIHDQISAIQQEQGILDRGVKAPGGELADPAMAQKYAENVAKITSLTQEQGAFIVATAEETERRTHEIQAQQLADELANVEEQTRVHLEGAKRQDAAVRTSYEDRAISTRRYLETVQAEASAEYETQAASIAREMQMVKQAGDAKIITEEQVAKRLEELWKQEQQAQQQMLNQTSAAQDAAAKRQEESIRKLAQQWGQDWTKMANDVLLHRETIGRALMQIGQQMEIQLIDKGIQMVVTKTASLLLRLLANHVAFLAQLLGIETAGAAAKKARDTAVAVSEISSSAGVAGAAGFASVMEALPFPANIAAAPGVMAAAIATTMGNLGFVGAFEKGGVVPATGFALMHEGEGVLTAQQMMTINNSSSSSSSSRQTGPIRVTNNFPSTGKMTPNDIAAHVRRGIRTGLIKVGL